MSIPIKDTIEAADKIADSDNRKKLTYLLIIIGIVVGLVIRQLWADNNLQHDRQLKAIELVADTYKELYETERKRRQESDAENKRLWSEKNNDTQRTIESNEKVISEIKKLAQ